MGKSFKTFLKHTAKDYHNQSVNPPVVRASTIIFKSMQDIRKTQNKAKNDPTGGHYDYGRQGTSTTYILSQILKKANLYSDLYAKENDTFYPIIIIIFKAFYAFFRTYFLQRGFLAGWRGFVLAVSNSIGVFYKYIKIYARRKQKIKK